MLRLDLQFYAFFMIVLCGAGLGLLFDLLRFLVRQCRLNRWLTAAADMLFWGVATLSLSGALFYGNWGELRLYVLVGLLLGLFLYFWLASAMVLEIAGLLLRMVLWFIDLVLTIWQRLIWGPVVAVLMFIWSILRTLVRWGSVFGQGTANALVRLTVPLWRPFRRTYRWMKLQYLLAKRRWRRRFRR